MIVLRSSNGSLPTSTHSWCSARQLTGDCFTAISARTAIRAETLERIIGAGVETVGGTSHEFGALIRAEIATWGKLLKNAGIRDDYQDCCVGTLRPKGMLLLHRPN